MIQSLLHKAAETEIRHRKRIKELERKVPKELTDTQVEQLILKAAREAGHLIKTHQISLSNGTPFFRPIELVPFIRRILANQGADFG